MPVDALLFPEPTVSRVHAILDWDPSKKRYLLTHQSTTNATLINGRPVKRPQHLNPGDQVRMGNLIFEIRIGIGQHANPAQGQVDVAQLIRAASQNEVTAPPLPSVPPTPPREPQVVLRELERLEEEPVHLETPLIREAQKIPTAFLEAETGLLPPFPAPRDHREREAEPAPPEEVPEPAAEVEARPPEEVSPEPVAEVETSPPEEVAPEPVAEVEARPPEEVAPEPAAEVETSPPEEVVHEPAAEVETRPPEEVIPEPEAVPRQQPIRRSQPKIGRNAPCPCGTGKKYKKCCGRG